MTRLRGTNYEPLLPEVDAQFRELDSRMRLRLEQKKNVGKRLQAMLTAPRPEYLATAEERIAGERLAAIEKKSSDPAIARRVAHLRGILTWRLRTEYHERLTAAFVHLKALETTSRRSRVSTTPSCGRVRRRRRATSATTSRSSGSRARRRGGHGRVEPDGPAGSDDRDGRDQPAHRTPGRLAGSRPGPLRGRRQLRRAARAQAGEEAR
jgi:hypothetical protein